MLIVDETIETSSGDRTERITRKPIVSFKEEKALYVRPLPRIGALQVMPFPHEKHPPNLREIAGNRAYEYLAGKRYYVLRDEKDEQEVSLWSRKVKIVIGIFGMILGAGIIIMIKYGGTF